MHLLEAARVHSGTHLWLQAKAVTSRSHLLGVQKDPPDSSTPASRASGTTWMSAFPKRNWQRKKFTVLEHSCGTWTTNEHGFALVI